MHANLRIYSLLDFVFAHLLKFFLVFDQSLSILLYILFLYNPLFVQIYANKSQSPDMLILMLGPFVKMSYLVGDLNNYQKDDTLDSCI